MERIQFMNDLKPPANLYHSIFFYKQLILEFFYYIDLVFILTSSVYLLNKY